MIATCLVLNWAECKQAIPSLCWVLKVAAWYQGFAQLKIEVGQGICVSICMHVHVSKGIWTIEPFEPWNVCVCIWMHVRVSKGVWTRLSEPLSHEMCMSIWMHVRVNKSTGTKGGFSAAPNQEFNKYLSLHPKRNNNGFVDTCRKALRLAI